MAGKIQLCAEHIVYDGYWRDATSRNYHYSKIVAVIINISGLEFVKSSTCMYVNWLLINMCENTLKFVGGCVRIKDGFFLFMVDTLEDTEQHTFYYVCHHMCC